MTDQELREDTSFDHIAFGLGGIALVAGGTRPLLPELADSLGLAKRGVLAGGVGGLFGYVNHRICSRITGADADPPAERKRRGPS